MVSTEGSWEAGVDGALPGIVMPADPEVGDAYRQEFYAGEAEDMAEVIAVGGSVVPAGSFDDVVTTRTGRRSSPTSSRRSTTRRASASIAETQTAGRRRPSSSSSSSRRPVSVGRCQLDVSLSERILDAMKRTTKILVAGGVVAGRGDRLAA